MKRVFKTEILTKETPAGVMLCLQEDRVVLDGVLLGNLQTEAFAQVEPVQHGAEFRGVIERSTPLYKDGLLSGDVLLKLKFCYDLKKGETAIANSSITDFGALTRTPPHKFITRIAGVTFEGRQHAMKDLREGEEVFLTREPWNRYDAGCIAVMKGDGQQLGNIHKTVSRLGDSRGLAAEMDSGKPFRCLIHRIDVVDDVVTAAIEIIEGTPSKTVATSRVHPAQSRRRSASAAPEQGNPGLVLLIIVVFLAVFLFFALKVV